MQIFEYEILYILRIKNSFFETTISDTKMPVANQKNWSHKKTYKTYFV